MAKCNVGGQAVIEGVMMKNQDKLAVAVRKNDGEIIVDKKDVNSFAKKLNIHKIPFLRGSIMLIETMIEGIKALNFSASFFEEGSSEESKFDEFLKKIFKDKTDDVLIFISMLIAIVLSVSLFMVLPTFIGGVLKNMISNIYLLNFTEGLIRISFFVLYIKIISKNEDIKRVFKYHGAEHKTIYCYESDMDLTVENARKFTTLHPRCGTNFVFIVLMVSMFIFSLFGWPDPLIRVVFRVVMLPIIAGISYEVIKLAGKNDKNPILKFIIFPGLMLQKITTIEPDDEQLEVAIESLKAVI
ncbi:MAG: DUF1385 domain-containing protein [Peptostreptococcaceae bacterium]|jgi:uncharacterized protein YqhQ|nr:DUF1385 domain-containing protein [Peptostreptococcaceae bacterium]